MLTDFFSWLSQQPQGTASFIGTLAGSSLGFFALLAGALFNARLNRNQDDRWRDQERTSLATALYAELKQLHDILIANAQMLEAALTAKPSPQGELHVRTPHVRLFPELVKELGLLPPDTIRAVADAYGIVDQSTYRADKQVRFRDQSQDCESARDNRARALAGARRRGDRISAFQLWPIGIISPPGSN